MFGNVKNYDQYKTNSERAIAKRKVYINQQNWLQSKLKNETHMKHTAEWENRGKGVM